MRNSFRIKLVAATALACGLFTAHAETPPKSAVQDSVKTVDSLLKIENAAALAKAKADELASGLVKGDVKTINGGAPVKPVEPPMSVRVVAITALRGDYRVKLNVNGQSFDDMRVGSPVKGCVLTEIRDRCVVLQPAPSETIIESKADGGKAQQKGKGRSTKKETHTAAVKPQSCPTSCWTGITPPAPTITSAGAPLPMGGPPGAPLAPRAVQPGAAPVAPPAAQDQSASSFN